MSARIGGRARPILGRGEYLLELLRGLRQRWDLTGYLRSDRRPWRRGYAHYRDQYLADVLRDPVRLDAFREGRPLPTGYGYRLDARVVEIPWALSRIAHRSGPLLDAGSSLNREAVLTAPALSTRALTIVTLAPETTCFWHLGASYVFGDLRELYFRDASFDDVVCISTIEHVGMDTSRYAPTSDPSLQRGRMEFLEAIRELRRVLRPGGSLHITIPFGLYEDHGWLQQFDATLLDTLVAAFSPSGVAETVFRYGAEGWALSDRAASATCRFFDVHRSKYFDPSSDIDFPPSSQLRKGRSHA